jgi:hypothetical protein
MSGIFIDKTDIGRPFREPGRILASERPSLTPALTRSLPLARLPRNLRLRQILLAASQATRISRWERGNCRPMVGNDERSHRFMDLISNCSGERRRR